MAQIESASRVVAIIPARGGSRGIPRKNMAEVAGRSLVARAVSASIYASSVDRVYVTTDDPEIESEAHLAGATSIRRPAELAGDESSTEAALLHALDVISKDDVRPAVLVLVQCTSPFVDPADIDRVVQAVDAGADTAFSACRFHGFVWRRTEMGMGGVNHDPSERLLRQDRQSEYLENGAVYAMDVEGFKRHKHRFFGSIEVVEMPASRSLEVDEPEDLEIARAL